MAIVGRGRLGRACAERLRETPPLALAGIVRRADSLAAAPTSSACAGRSRPTPLFADEPTLALAVDDVASLEQENRGLLVERMGEGPSGPHASLILEARFDLVAFTFSAWRYTPAGLVPPNDARAAAAG